MFTTVSPKLSLDNNGIELLTFEIDDDDVVGVGVVGVVEFEAGLGSSITGKRLFESLTTDTVDELWKKILRRAATFVLSRISSSNDSADSSFDKFLKNEL